MNKIEIKNRWTGEVIFEYSKENNTMRDTVLEAINKGANLSNAVLSNAVLSGAVLRGTDLRGTDLIGAVLRGAVLRGTDLIGANLRSADLSGAVLSDANLRDADLIGADLATKNVFSISRIGSANRMTTFDADNNIIWCGCFTGTIEQFEQEVRKTHAGIERHLHNYLCVINYFKSLKLNTNEK